METLPSGSPVTLRYNGNGHVADLDSTQLGPEERPLLVNSLVQNAAALAEAVSDAVVAREEVLRLVIVSLLAKGHLLLSDLPGTGKTLVARSVASSISGSFKRIQCTPDLLPSDVTGSSIFLMAQGRFEFVPGPIFANLILADEINRASPRTQSAFLEAMAEGQVSADGQSHPLPDPFWVVATQNEVDGFGTFPLPHAQLDRFMMTLTIGYPDVQEQVTILERNEGGDPEVGPVLTVDHIREMQTAVGRIGIATPVREYLAQIAVATRRHPQLTLGISPRAAVQLQRASQAMAALQGDAFVAPEHIKAVAAPVLAHRIIPVPSASLTSRDVIEEILESEPVPM